MIPAPLRSRYGLAEGMEVLFEETAEGLLLRPAVTLPVEMYFKERRAAFLLENAVDRADYERARQEVQEMGLDPDTIGMKGLRPKAAWWIDYSSTPTCSFRPLFWRKAGRRPGRDPAGSISKRGTKRDEDQFESLTEEPFEDR